MKHIFLTSYLMGGLGNQMFQIAKAVSEGLKHNIDVFFRGNSYTPMEGNQPTKYIENIYRYLKFDNNKIPFTRINETSFSYYETNFIYTLPTEFYGYYQSSKNFNGYDDEIINLFSPTDKFKDKLMFMYPKIFDENSVSIHLRRGDYLTIPDILPPIDKSYFDYCLSKLDYSHIFIFTNDKKWAEDNMNYNNATIIYGLEDYEELWAMSLCNHNIMSNSSFSWWGSYLNKNKNKKVFVPSVWFGPKGEKYYDSIYEDDWIKIQTKFLNKKIICY